MDNKDSISGIVGGPELWALRKVTALEVTELMTAVGIQMAEYGGSGSDKEKSIHVMGNLLQMCGELGQASARMLSGKNHYAGAALLRQIVEIEYLTWTFEKGKSDTKTWLEATDKERMRMFTPAQLRKNSKGRFLQADYKNHCEVGGHPVPKGVPLLGGKSLGQAQFLLVDLLLHCWRTWDQVKAWSEENGYSLVNETTQISGRFGRWGHYDPVYKKVCMDMPETDPDRKLNKPIKDTST